MDFLRRDSESWQDSKIPDLILKIPVYHAYHVINNIRINTKFYENIYES